MPTKFLQLLQTNTIDSQRVLYENGSFFTDFIKWVIFKPFAQKYCPWRSDGFGVKTGNAP